MRKQKTTESAETLRKSSQWKDVWIRLRRNKLAMVGMVIAVLLALMAIFAPVIAPYDYQVQSIANRLQMIAPLG